MCSIAAIVLFVGTVAAYGRRELLGTDAFTRRAVAVMHEEPVRQQIAETLTRQAVEAGSPDLVALRPLIEGTIARLLDSGALDPVVALAAGELHRSLFAPGGSPLVLSLADALAVAQGVVSAVQPGTTLPDASTVGLVRVADRDGTGALRAAERVRWLGVVLPVLAVVMLGLAIAAATHRRRAVTATGLAVGSAGLLVVLTMAGVRPFVVGRFDGDLADVARATWNGLLGDLSRWGLLLIGAGALIAAAAASIIPATDVPGGLTRIRRLLLAAPPGRLGTWARAGRAVAAIGVGILAVADAETTLRLVFLVAGAIAIMWGISEILRMSGPSDQPDVREEVSRLRQRAGLTAAGLTGGLAAAAVAALGVLALATGGGAAAPAPGPAPCNGHPELCDRRLDEVAMVTTHNSMSVARTPGWFNAHHYNPIEDQLDAGVRGLLIDTWLGQETTRNGFGGTRLVQTDLSDTSREALVAEIGEAAVAAAERLSGRILYGESVDTPKLYLCHGLCELGATDAVEEFRRIRQWLDDHPDQVVVIVIQDEATIDQDVAAIEGAGLDERAWPERLTPDSPLPTLRQMIDEGKTAVIMHESAGNAGPAWYQSAYSITQETPYLFRDVAAISSPASCVPNRGPGDAKLFLLNHWLDEQPVRAGQADAVNRREVLLARARLCRSERGRFPNLVAVNFVELRDAASVVDELNGIVEEPVVTGG